MKLAVLLLVAALLGSSIGLGLTWWEFRHAREDFGLRDSSASADGSTPYGEPRANVSVVGESTYNFGVMQRGEERSHTFLLRNDGNASATLKLGETSCQCTLGELEREELRPGETVEVTLTWHADSYALEFEQGAEILIGGDPELPALTLRIQGRVTQAVRPDPEHLALGSLSASEDRQFGIKLYSYRSADWEPGEPKLLDADLARFFDFSLHPLSAEEIRREPGALGGRQLNVIVKSGLPLGPIQQTIRVPVNLGELAPLEIPVEGKVVGDITLFGPRFQTDDNRLRLGAVPRSQGTTAELSLVVKGEYRNDIQFTIAEIDPEENLAVALGAGVSINDRVTRFPLTIEVKPESRPVNRLGSQQGKLGKIRLETTHPVSREIVIYVQFAVE